MKTPWIITQIALSLLLWLPLLLLLISLLRKLLLRKRKAAGQFEADFAVIVTAYQQVDLIDDVVFSILRNDYNNYIIYVVADNCDIGNITFDSDKVVLLRPENVLASNVKSHFYAINNFRRAHNAITIIDSDNIVHKKYLSEINNVFRQGYNAVQGIRAARNLNTSYARIDEAGDIYYRYIDRKLLFEAGSSSSLAGSGMAFKTDLFVECMKDFDKTGAGFDKVLQYEIVNRNERIAFSEAAIVYDGKTSKSDQLVKQRARWMNAWFRYWILGLRLFVKSVISLSWNRFAFSLMMLRPPLFILCFLGLFMSVISLFVTTGGIAVWAIAFIIFTAMFFKALFYFKAGSVVFKALVYIPRFIYFLVLALFKARGANKLSVATKHDVASIKKMNG